jgi:methylamine methyltransferase corrinoid protein reductive activase
MERLGVCGNPTQLSLFQGIEIRDLAFAGKRKLDSLGVVAPEREAAIVAARTISGLNLPGGCEVIIPPTVRHEVGADALAMMIKTGLLEREETTLVTDFGTNAEVALFHDGTVFTGSTAAGPALEGQQITCGKLAAPWVIADLEPEGPYHRLILLDDELLPVRGDLVDLGKEGVVEKVDTPRPIGITGTGTIAVVNQAMAAGLIALPRITTEDRRLYLGEDIFFTEEDLAEAGKAIGAVRAGHMTLCHEAGIAPEDILTAYMSGASGTYVDAIKAQRIGMIPPRIKTVYQVGNTSLAMAVDLTTDPGALGMMSNLASRLRATHCMFAASRTFQNAYILELSYWIEGMPMSDYRKFLKKFGLADLPPVQGPPEIIHTVKRDIDVLGRLGLTVITAGR